jgi:hypothetical protein
MKAHGDAIERVAIIGDERWRDAALTADARTWLSPES